MKPEDQHQITEAEVRRIHKNAGGLHHQSIIPDKDTEIARLKDKLGKADQIVRGFGKMVAERDAQIERLLVEIGRHCKTIDTQQRLIAELCDELEYHNQDHLQDDLIQRAREAAK